MSKVNPSEITAALLQSIETGAYPQSQDVAAAELSSEAIPPTSKAIGDARNKVEEEISRLSDEVAPDVDGWIEQAQKLQADIEQSKAVAREIVKQAEVATSLREARRDVATKLDLLRAEVNYNTRLEGALESIKHVADKLHASQDAVQEGKLNVGLERYEEAQSSLEEMKEWESTNAIDLLHQRAAKTRANLIQLAERHWFDILSVDYEGSRISIHLAVENESGLSLDTVAGVMKRLAAFDEKLNAFCRDLNNIVLKPCLHVFSNGSAVKVTVGEDNIHVNGRTSAKGAVQLIDDLTSLLTLLGDRLPASFITPVSENIMPSLIPALISAWLNTSVKSSLESLTGYEILLGKVSEFATFLTQKGWQGATDLAEWVDDAPKVWLAKRRETSLTSVRNTLTHTIRNTKVVERVETQMVTKDDIIAPQNGVADDWDAAWAEGDEEDSAVPVSTKAAEEEDVSAWDAFAEEQPLDPMVEETSRQQETKSTEESEEDAWGWDDQENENGQQSTEVQQPHQTPKPNGHSAANNNERELTLKEVYTVTGVPDELVGMTLQIISDACSLRQPDYANSPVAAAAAAMYSIPTIVLAGFRALAPTYYEPLEGGNMYLYNDSLRLGSELESLRSHQAAEDAKSGLSQSAWPSTRMKLDSDIEALSSFGKRAYGKEMESQRTILGDLLDGAQGFANCTEAPFAAECEGAVSMTVDRLREVRRQWSPILSKSALLQSLGSLLATVLNKIMADICDLSDISEEDSKRLREFCDEFSKLSDMFVQEGPDGEQTDMAGMYTPNWFKFQYLGEVLESSLADIKYLWQEGGLKLEFEASEIIDLVEALFADSDHRRRAIADIRRG